MAIAGREAYGWSIGQLLDHAARRFPDLTCFLTPGGRSLTFRQVQERVDRLCDALWARGVRPGTRIGLLDTDSVAYAELLLACFRLGATYVPVNFRLADDEVATIMERARVEWFFVGERYVESARKAVEPLDAPCVLASLDGSLPLDLEDLVREGRPVAPDVQVPDDAVLGIMFTSGTTGLPKGVVQSHAMLKRMMFMGTEVVASAGEARYTASPLFHIAGWSLVFMQLQRGCASLITPQFDAGVTARLISDGTLSGVFLVPTMIDAVLSVLGPPTPAERLGTVLYGSAPMPPTLLRRALQRFPDCQFWNMFGAGTESGCQTLLRPEDHRRALAGQEELLTSVGQPMLGVDLRILDDDGTPLPPGVVGNIAVRTDSLMDGYLDMPEQTAQALHDGWFYGGDRGWVDARGYLYLGGRSRDMIIRGGENIYVQEIEHVLTGVPGVRDAAVVGRPDERWGEVAVAFVECDRSAPRPTPAQLEAACRARLASYKVPVSYVVLDDLPRNPTGKVRKADLAARREVPA